MSTQELTISPLECAYLAGFFDGEGHVSIHRRDPKTRNKDGAHRSNYVTLAVMTSTNLDVLHWVQSRCGGQIYDKSQDARIRSGANKRFYQLVLAQRDAVVAFFSCIHPYVIIKKKHVELARAFLALPKYVRLHSPLKDLMYRQMKALNHRGGLNFQLELL